MIERDFKFLPDSREVHDRWRSLLVAHNIQGVQVHDARLAASMYVHGIGQLLTINVRDFRRFEGLRITHPAELSQDNMSKRQSATGGVCPSIPSNWSQWNFFTVPVIRGGNHGQET